ncbi:MAG: dTDP-4-dehydrorhamnose 3,5-epimerase [Ignavibacteria bacterium]|nr:dTDP-4-dehydrorhamnose 3,5-epimerase [Ignavibacteria bacterium]
MGFSIIETYFDAIILIQADVYEDERGIFMESYQREAFRALGIDEEFVQENHSVSALGVIRGMHFQWDKPMGKLLRVTSGRAHVKEIDIRKNSPTLGQSMHVELRASEPHLLWVPPGFANGFMSMEHGTEMVYKCSAKYNPRAESCIAWNDPALALEWPVHEIDTEPILSIKDIQAQTLAEWLQRPDSSAFKV